MKRKNSNETVHAVLTKITKKTEPQKKSTSERNLLEFSKKICRAEGIQVYSAMKETKAAFAELTIRSLEKDCTVPWKTMNLITFTN